MNEKIETNIAEIEKLIAAKTPYLQVEETHHLILPEGYKHTDITKEIEKLYPHPARKQGKATLYDLDSFLLYVHQQADDQTTRIYVDVNKRKFTAVFNDHGIGNGASAYAGWGDFKAEYEARLSREFSIWLKHDRTAMEQEKFAEFIEENYADILPEYADTLTQTAHLLQAKTEINFNSSKRLDNGQTQLTYTENIDATAGTGLVQIPREFSIGMRVFDGGDGYRINARLKYRIGAGKVKFWYELDRYENALEQAFAGYVEQVRAAGFTVLLGTP